MPGCNKSVGRVKFKVMPPMCTEHSLCSTWLEVEGEWGEHGEQHGELEMREEEEEDEDGMLMPTEASMILSSK